MPEKLLRMKNGPPFKKNTTEPSTSSKEQKILSNNPWSRELSSKKDQTLSSKFLLTSKNMPRNQSSRKNHGTPSSDY